MAASEVTPSFSDPLFASPLKIACLLAQYLNKRVSVSPLFPIRTPGTFMGFDEGSNSTASSSRDIDASISGKFRNYGFMEHLDCCVIA